MEFDRTSFPNQDAFHAHSHGHALAGSTPTPTPLLCRLRVQPFANLNKLWKQRRHCRKERDWEVRFLEQMQQLPKICTSDMPVRVNYLTAYRYSVPLDVHCTMACSSHHGAAAGCRGYLGMHASKASWFTQLKVKKVVWLFRKSTVVLSAT